MTTLQSNKVMRFISTAVLGALCSPLPTALSSASERRDTELKGLQYGNQRAVTVHFADPVHRFPLTVQQSKGKKGFVPRNARELLNALKEDIRDAGGLKKQDGPFTTCMIGVERFSPQKPGVPAVKHIEGYLIEKKLRLKDKIVSIYTEQSRSETYKCKAIPTQRPARNFLGYQILWYHGIID